MKYYLHTTPVSETLSLEDTQIHKRFALYESSLNEFLDQISNIATGVESFVEPVSQIAAAFIPGGDLIYYGYRAYEDFNEISDEIKKLHEALAKVGADIDFSKSPEDNADVIKNMNIPGPAERETIKEFVKQIAISSFNFLVDASTAIPLEVIPGMMAVDSAIDLAISGISTAIGSLDPEGKNLSENMIKFSELFKQKMDLIENKMIEVGESLGISKGTLEKMKILTNYVGNLGMIYRHMSEGVQAVSSSD
jgi:archaellum component FlaC